MKSLLASVILSLFGMAAPQLSNAQPVADFYKAKGVTVIIGYDVGGGYDLYGRALARHLKQHIPGAPTIVVQNMVGAGGLRAANFLYNIAPRDGSVIGLIDQSIQLQQMLEPENVRLDVTKFNWIGRMVTNAAVLYSWHTAPVKTIKDLFDRDLLLASTGQNSRIMSSFLNNQLGVKIKLISGYKGTGDTILALEREEVQALTQPWSQLRTESAEWLRDKKINLLLQMGVASHPELKHVPLVVDLARSPDDRRLLELISSGSEIGRSIMSPPATAAERIAVLRSGFMATMNNPEFREEAKKLGLDLEIMSGEDLQAFIVKQADISPELLERARKLAGLEAVK